MLTRFRRAAASAWTGTARRVRGADWAALAAELAMIVVGILIAFQLDRWAEGWRGARDRRIYLERLGEEAGTNVTLLNGAADQFDRDTLEVRGLLVALTDPARAPANFRPRPGFACNMLRLPAIRLQTGATSVAADAGALDLVPDSHLRRLMQGRAASDRFVDMQLDYFRAFFLRYADHIDPHLETRFEPRTSRVSCRVRFDRLAADPVAISTVTRIYQDRLSWRRVRRGQLSEHRRLQARVRCLLADNCPSQEEAKEGLSKGRRPR